MWLREKQQPNKKIQKHEREDATMNMNQIGTEELALATGGIIDDHSK